jgi:hypothetical protein
VGRGQRGRARRTGRRRRRGGETHLVAHVAGIVSLFELVAEDGLCFVAAVDDADGLVELIRVVLVGAGGGALVAALARVGHGRR